MSYVKMVSVDEIEYATIVDLEGDKYGDCDLAKYTYFEVDEIEGGYGGYTDLYLATEFEEIVVTFPPNHRIKTIPNGEIG